MVRGHHGIEPPRLRPNYTEYKSPYGPIGKIPPNFHGIDLKRATRFGITAGSFGAVAGIFALFFFSDVPRVRKDIMQKVPFLGDLFVKSVPPSDNVRSVRLR